VGCFGFAEWSIFLPLAGWIVRGDEETSFAEIAMKLQLTGLTRVIVLKHPKRG